MKIIEFVNPSPSDNQRLINQQGLFTKAPVTGIEGWIKRNFKGEKHLVLCKIDIKDQIKSSFPLPGNIHIHPKKITDRRMFLRALNLMNINHATLFPDIYGAAKYCNIDQDVWLE